MRSRLIVSASAVAAAAIALTAFLFVQGPPEPAGPGAAVPPVDANAVPPPDGWYAVLNAYVASPEALPGGALRYEMTVVKAALEREGSEAVFFEGARRLMLQPGTVEKLLSEKVPQGRWERLRLTFSPAAETIDASGKSFAGLVEAREIVIALPTELKTGRTLSFVTRLRAPIAADRGGAVALSFQTMLLDAETYELGGAFLDTRGRGEIFTLSAPSLANIIDADLGLDITAASALPGSEGFVPPNGAPSGAPSEGP